MNIFPQTLEETELANRYSAGWLVQDERKGGSEFVLFLRKLYFQKHFYIEHEGFLWSISAVLSFHCLTQAEGQPLKSLFHIWLNGQRQYPNLHPGMKSKQSVAQTTSFNKGWSASQQQHATLAASNSNSSPNYAGSKLCSALGTANRQSNGQRIYNLNLDVLPQREQSTLSLWTKGVWEPQPSPQKVTAWIRHK